MKDILRTNNAALISFVEALLKSVNIQYFVADQAISAAEGSIGMFPKRVLVSLEQYEMARNILIEAGLENELRPVNPRGIWTD